MNSLSVKLGLPNNSAIVRVVNDDTRGISLPLAQDLGFKLGVDMNWFLLDEGPMLRGEPFVDPRINSIAYFRDHYDKENPTDLMRIFGFEDCDYAFNVLGDAMSPKYRHGDIVLCKEISVEKIVFGEAYFIITQDRPIVRYIKGQEDNLFKFGAEVARYNESFIKIEDISDLFMVKGVVRREAF